MKFLVLALCVCAASAATIQPWQYRAEPQRFSQVFSKSVVNNSPFAYRAFEPIVKVEQPTFVKVEQPIVKSVTVSPVAPIVPVTAAPIVPVAPFAPVAVARSSVYNPAVLAKNVYADKEAGAGIVRSDSEVAADGFNYAYETENGIAAQSSGVLKTIDNEHAAIAVQGSYQYIAPDGTPVEVSYIADENGFQPKSNVLPVAPAIPEAIARSLEYLRAHPSKLE